MEGATAIGLGTQGEDGTQNSSNEPYPEVSLGDSMVMGQD
jgi:hypothetical protein